MKLKDLKIGTKLFGGYIIILLLTTLIGVISYIEISKIVHQIEISKIVNNIIEDAGEAQAGSLRYIIYKDKKYYDMIEEESVNIIHEAEDVKNLLLSDQNKEVADEIKHAMEEYEQSNVAYYKQEKVMQKDIETAVAMAMDVTKEIKAVIDAATAFSRSNKNDYSAVERVYMVQDALNSINKTRITAHFYLEDPTEELHQSLLKEIAEVRALLNNAHKLMASNVTKVAIQKAHDELDIFEEQFKEIRSIFEKESEINTEQQKSAKVLLSSAHKLRDGVFDVVQDTKSKSYLYLVLVVLAAIILGLGIGLFITRSITSPLSKGVSFANYIANGDLSKNLEVHQKDEIGVLSKALGNMLIKLREIVTSVVVGADNMSSASQQINTTSQQLSQGANEQASSVEEVSSTMEEITSNIEQNSENAGQAERMSISAQEGINEVNESSQKAIDANKQISEKIGIINDIAFQTNILALNAAVEAARAGEHGRGFAVVAAEVRKLAENSKAAAEEIVTLSENGLKLSQEAGDKLAEMLPEIEKTTRLVQEISSASSEQTNGAGQVNNAMQQLNGVTQQNAASSEELASSAEEMNAQSEQLKQIIAFFKIDENSGSTSPREFLRAPQVAQKFNSKQNHNKSGVQIRMTDKDKLDSEFEAF